MFMTPKQNIELLRTFSSITELHNLISAFELLFDTKPQMEIKGYLSSEYDGGSSFEYMPVEKVTKRNIYFNDHECKGIPYFLTDHENYFVRLSK